LKNSNKIEVLNM